MPEFLSKTSLLLVLLGAVSISCTQSTEESATKSTAKAATEPTTEPAAEPTTKAAAEPPAKAKTPDELVQTIEEALNSVGGDINERNAIILEAVEELLVHEDASEMQKDNARNMKVFMLFQAVNAAIDEAPRRKDLDEYVTQLRKEFPKSEAAALGSGYQLALKYLSSSEPTGNAEKDFADYAKTYPENPLGFQLFEMYADKISPSHPKEAISILERGVKIYSDHRDVRMLREALTKLEIIGKPMELSGPTLEGKQFDLSSFKGKVVLVDFWATWCPPCVFELPNVKKTYEKYHDKGFEVVGVSLDDIQIELENFVEEREIPWPQIIFAEEKDRGWKNPLAVKFGITGIPATFLIGRDGTVVSMDLRGDNLEEVVAKEVGAKQPATGSDE